MRPFPVGVRSRGREPALGLENSISSYEFSYILHVEEPSTGRAMKSIGHQGKCQMTYTAGCFDHEIYDSVRINPFKPTKHWTG